MAKYELKTAHRLSDSQLRRIKAVARDVDETEKSHQRMAMEEAELMPLPLNLSNKVPSDVLASISKRLMKKHGLSGDFIDEHIRNILDRRMNRKGKYIE